MFLDSPSNKQTRLEKLILAEVEAGRSLLALESVNEVSDDSRKADLLVRIIENTEPQDLEKLFERIGLLQNVWIRREIAAQLAFTAAKSSREDLALRLTEEPDAYAGAMAYAGAAEALAATDRARALALFQGARVAAASVAKKERAGAYLAVGLAEARAGFVEEALPVLQLAALSVFLENDPGLRARRFTEVGQGFLKIGNSAEALTSAYRAKAVIARVKNDDELRARLLARAAQVMALAGAGDDASGLFLNAARLAARLKSLARRVTLLCEIALIQHEAGKTEDASATLDAARLQAVREKRNDKRTDLLGEVALARLAMKDLPGALRMLADLSSELRKGDLLAKILYAHAEGGNFDEAMATARAQNSTILTLRGMMACANGLLSKQEADRTKARFELPRMPSSDYQ